MLFGPKATTWPVLGVNMAGIVGPAGPQGVAGATGATGGNGATGAAGATGPQGSQGTQGLQGIAGIDGKTVIAGKAVLYGAADPDSGTASVDGDFYINTTSHTLFGPKAGTWPVVGVSMVGITGAQGAQGVAGASGAAGAVGPAGPTGLTGNTGPTGTTNASLITTGTLPVANGGTGQTGYAVGDLLYASTTTVLSKLADVATGSALISGGAGAAPSWGTPVKATNVAGGVAGAVNYQSGAGTTGFSAAGTSGQLLTSNGTGAPTWTSNIAGTVNLLSDAWNNTKVGTNTFNLASHGSKNTAIGENTLTSVTGSSWNSTAVGYQALMSATGSNNTAVGSGALTANTTGNANTASGLWALYSNTTGSYNTAFGEEALYSNTTASQNTASGAGALKLNTTGTENTGVGSGALVNNTAGNTNTGVGRNAGGWITTGSNNTAVGFGSAYLFTTGNDNTAIGAQTNITVGITNATVIGMGASVVASNAVRIGNTNVTYIGGQVAWTNASDRRLKQNILSSGLGLDFIQKLRPVTYSFITQPTVTQEGLIAQEVEAAAQSLGVTFYGVKVPATPDGHYSLTYSDFVMPLINSVKELKAENDALKVENEGLKTRLVKIEKALGL